MKACADCHYVYESSFTCCPDCGSTATKSPLPVRSAAAPIAQTADARDAELLALKMADRLCKEALPKFNWGASALDANAIKLLNEVPGLISAAISAGKEGV